MQVQQVLPTPRVSVEVQEHLLSTIREFFEIPWARFWNGQEPALIFKESWGLADPAR